jgi:hypothetical protein
LGRDLPRLLRLLFDDLFLLYSLRYSVGSISALPSIALMLPMFVRASRRQRPGGIPLSIVELLSS